MRSETGPHSEFVFLSEICSSRQKWSKSMRDIHFMTTWHRTADGTTAHKHQRKSTSVLFHHLSLSPSSITLTAFKPLKRIPIDGPDQDLSIGDKHTPEKDWWTMVSWLGK